MSNVSDKTVKETLESLGLWMESRYMLRRKPIQKWKGVPRREKDFFTFYAMNLALESDGFGMLAGLHGEDVKRFIRILDGLGAKKTAQFVKSTLDGLKNKTITVDYKHSSRYYRLLRSEKIWMPLLRYMGSGIYLSYLKKAQQISAAGGNTFDPKQWRGKLPKV
jgi:hypothetical protein